MRRVVIATGAAALAGLVLLAGCSGAAKSSGGLDGRATDNAQNQTAGGGYSASVPGAVPAARAPAGSAAQVKAAVTSTALIRTADLEVEIARGSDVAAQANRAGQIATAAGGAVYADDRTAGKMATAALTLKVPGESLSSVLTKLSLLGKEKARSSSTKDVTTEVADVGSRVRSAQASIDRLRVLFSRAEKVGDVIALESELAQREADLESLQAQQRSLASQTELATVTLNLTTAPATAGGPTHQDRGFVGGLQRGWRAFTRSAGAVATAAGAALPFLGLGLVVLGAAVLLRRRTRNTTPPVIAPPAAS